MTPDEFDYELDRLIEMRKITIGPDERGRWWDAMKSTETPVFREAVRRMTEEDDHYPSAPYIRGVCHSIANERLSRAVQPTPPSGLTMQEYSRWEREWRRQIVRGATPQTAATLALEARSREPLVEAQDNDSKIIEGTIIGW